MNEWMVRLTRQFTIKIIHFDCPLTKAWVHARRAFYGVFCFVSRISFPPPPCPIPRSYIAHPTPFFSLSLFLPLSLCVFAFRFCSPECFRLLIFFAIVVLFDAIVISSDGFLPNDLFAKTQKNQKQKAKTNAVSLNEKFKKFFVSFLARRLWPFVVASQQNVLHFNKCPDSPPPPPLPPPWIWLRWYIFANQLIHIWNLNESKYALVRWRNNW